MITKNKLRSRVNARRRELETQNTKLKELLEKLTAFISAVKGSSVTYNLIKNLPVWKELEKLISGSDAE